MPDFELDHGGTAYVLLRARTAVDARTAGALRDAVGSVLREGRRFVVVDLTGSAAYGPQAFSALIGALCACRVRGGDLYLVGASEMVGRVLGREAGGPVRCFGSRGELDRALLGCSPAGGA